MRLATALALSLLGTVAYADPIFEDSLRRISVGGGPLYSSADGGHASGSGEVTLTLSELGPHASSGASTDGGTTYAYGEIAFWRYVTIGGGAGYLVRPNGAPGSGAIHLLVGSPLPIFGFGMEGNYGIGFHLSPYYRPIIPLSGSTGVIHEIGVNLKFSFSLIRKEYDF